MGGGQFLEFLDELVRLGFSGCGSVGIGPWLDGN